jgi:hypothetical protein
MAVLRVSGENKKAGSKLPAFVFKDLRKALGRSFLR